VDHHTATAEQFAANLAMASSRLAGELVRVIQFLMGSDESPVGNRRSTS